MIKDEIIDQLQRNLKAFRKIEDGLREEHTGRTVLLHDGEAVEIYDDSGDAYKVGVDKFGLGNFSLETVGKRPISLGSLTPLVAAS